MERMLPVPLPSPQDFGLSRNERWRVGVAIVFRFGAEDLLRCRFAVSPLRETMGALRTLRHPERLAYHLPWQRQVRSGLQGLDLAPLLALVPPAGYSPDFLSPPPDGPFTRIEAELERVRATPPERVHAEVTRCLAEQGDPRPPGAAVLLGDPVATRELLVELLARCWQVLVEPWWPRLRDLLEADIVFQARRFADGGMEAVLTDLHPRVRWRDDALHVAVAASGECDLSGRGLVLMPGVFEWPGVGVMLDPPWQPTLDYPVRGIALLWQEPAAQRAGLARLLGRTRATLLVALAEPTSITGLAARCGLPVSTVSEHVAVLRAAGLVAARRAGRHLLHEQTPLGIAMITAEAGP
jgi:DNA-binding transcriptional ArsR family regulator